MLRKLAQFALFLALAAFVGGSASAAVMTHGKEKVSIKLSHVPKVKTRATADAAFTLSPDGNTLHYRLKVGKIRDASMGHIHAVADDGTPGAILVWLYPTKGETPEVRKGKFSGSLAEGNITADRLEGPMKGGTVKDLYEKIENGKAGVAVHTEKNPGGELWGFHRAMEHKGRM